MNFMQGLKVSTYEWYYVWGLDKPGKTPVIPGGHN